MNETPQHIAFIMDGNGRWAKKRLLPRQMGHKEGVNALKRVVKACAEKGVGVVSFYCFSTENWSRPEDEVKNIFGLIQSFADKELKKYVSENYRVRIMGNLDGLPDDTREALSKIVKSAEKNDGIIVNLGINYGSRFEILNAVNELLAENVKNVDEKTFSEKLYTQGLCDPDIIVRSGGEQRLSNFMLWQSAYSEMIFIDDYWPDFEDKTVDKILELYKGRNRRFGRI